MRARKAPSGRVWTCCACGKAGVWGPGWVHYHLPTKTRPSPHVPGTWQTAEVGLFVVCSGGCEDRALASLGRGETTYRPCAVAEMSGVP